MTDDEARDARVTLELKMRPGVHPTLAVGKRIPPPPLYTETCEDGLLIRRNVAVKLRDGVHILVDIYRGADQGEDLPQPALLGWSPYGKHNTAQGLPWPEADVPAAWLSRHTAFEAPDPVFWCRHGYVVVYPDPRGSWYSEGELRHGGIEEGRDCYDLIEWMAQQPWCNGRIGMTGVSYLAAIQWQVGPLRPPHLAAINPCEGFSDWYREFAYHGGIPETGFLPRGCANLQWSTTRTEDTATNVREHPLYDGYWRSKECDLESVEVPAYVVASWSDHGLHTRGTIEAYQRIGSRQKWLEVHGRKKWHYYYRPDNVRRQLAFFDHFLKTAGIAVPAWPKVLLEIREAANVGRMRAESEWPLARTEYRKLYLDAREGRTSKATPVESIAELVAHPIEQRSVVRYQIPEERAVFDYRFKEPTELTGYFKLRLWVQAEGANDMDLFVAIQKLDTQREVVPFIFYAVHDNGPAALGWLRVSHRRLDLEHSRPERPVHLHVSEELLTPGQVVPVDIEIWPAAVSFKEGEYLRLIVQGRDIPQPSSASGPFARHLDTRNAGAHLIHTGGDYDSYLLAPFIPRAHRSISTEAPP